MQTGNTADTQCVCLKSAQHYRIGGEPPRRITPAQIFAWPAGHINIVNNLTFQSKLTLHNSHSHKWPRWLRRDSLQNITALLDSRKVRKVTQPGSAGGHLQAAGQNAAFMHVNLTRTCPEAHPLQAAGTGQEATSVMRSESFPLFQTCLTYSQAWDKAEPRECQDPEGEQRASWAALPGDAAGDGTRNGELWDKHNSPSALNPLCVLLHQFAHLYRWENKFHHKAGSIKMLFTCLS